MKTYKVVYYALVSITFVVFMTAFLDNRLRNTLSEDTMQKINHTWRALLMTLLPVCFILSLWNIFKVKYIARHNSISIAVLCLVLGTIMYIAYLSALAGRGAVG